MDIFSEYSPAVMQTVSVLLVDDDPFIQEQLSRILNRVVGTVHVAEDAEEALDFFTELGADIIITDLMLPGIDGLALADRIRKLDQDVPIIVATGVDEPDYIVRAVERNIDRLLLKPILPDALLSALSRSMRVILMRRRLNDADNSVRMVLDCYPNFVLLEEQGKVTYVNKQMLSYLGYDSYEAFCKDNRYVGDFLITADGGSSVGSDTWLVDILKDQLDREHRVEIPNPRMDFAVNNTFVVGFREFSMPGRNLVTLTDVTELEGERRKLEDEASHDPLTKCVNRRRFMSIMNEQEELCQNDGYRYSAIMLDIDHFKRINDDFGHDVGDAVLRELSELTRRNMRDSDVFARLGGEEFVLLAPGVGKRIAAQLAERLRHEISLWSFTGVDRAVTGSFGVAECVTGESGDAVLKRADQALYKAKTGGRNRVVIA